MPRRLAISRSGIWSRRCQRRMMLSMATSITPNSRSFPSGQVFYTWVNIRCKYLPWVGQDSVQINTVLASGQQPVVHQTVQSSRQHVRRDAKHFLELVEAGRAVERQYSVDL